MTKKSKNKEICFLYGLLHAIINGIWVKADHGNADETLCFYCQPFELELTYSYNKVGLLLNNTRKLSFDSYNRKWSIDQNKLLGIKYEKIKNKNMLSVRTTMWIKKRNLG